MNFIDVTLDLTTGKYNSYDKPGNVPIYINVESNHPPNFIKNLPESTFRHINKSSSDKSAILKVFIIMYFLAVVLMIKSNLIQILKRISVEIRTGKER